MEERRNRELALRDEDRDALRAIRAKDDSPKTPSGYRWTAGGELEPIPGGPATREARPKSYAPLAIERSLELEGVPRGSPEWNAAIKAARPVAGPKRDSFDKLVDEAEARALAKMQAGEAVAPGVEEPGLLEGVKNLIPTPEPAAAAGYNAALGGAPPIEAAPPAGATAALGGASPIAPAAAAEAPAAPTLGAQEDVRLEKRLGPEKAAGLRAMLGGITEPSKQRQAQGILRRLAKGTLSIEGAASELDALGSR
jgi:hypothetical protein